MTTPEALAIVVDLENKVHDLSKQLATAQAEAGVMRKELNNLLDIYGESGRESLDAVDEILAERALKSPAGASLLAERDAYREGWEAWEAWEEAPDAEFAEEELERIAAARDRIAALKGGTNG